MIKSRGKRDCALFIELFTRIVHPVIGKRPNDGTTFSHMDSFDSVKFTADTEGFIYFQLMDMYDKVVAKEAGDSFIPENAYVYSKKYAGPGAQLKPGGQEMLEHCMTRAENGRADVERNKEFLAAVKNHYLAGLGPKERKRKASADARRQREMENSRPTKLRAQLDQRQIAARAAMASALRSVEI